MGAPSENPDSWPPVLPGFGDISRRWDPAQELCASIILPGEYYVTRHHEIITTALGSCVSACIRDPISGVGGMNHITFPANAGKNSAPRGDNDAPAIGYGIAAMEALVNDILKRDSQKDRLQVKLYGGGTVSATDSGQVGERNVQLARQFLEAEGITIVTEDLGGTHPRKVTFFPKTGEVLVRRLRSMQNQAIATREKAYESMLGMSG